MENLQIKQIMNKAICGTNPKNKEEAAKKAYAALAAAGYSPAILNEKYISVNGTDYQFKKIRDTLATKKF